MNDLICKFAVREGKRFGETIDVYNGHIIVKISTDFIGIPLERVEKISDDEVHFQDFNENEAKQIGLAWIEEKSKPVSLEELKSYGFGEEQ